MAGNNYFVNAYKKNSQNIPKKEETNKEDTENRTVKTVKPFVFEKIPASPTPIPEKNEKHEDKKLEFTKVRISAVFLILVGVDKAASIVKSFNSDELDKIIKEIIKIENITEAELNAAEKQFGSLNISNLDLYRGGREFVRLLFQKLYGLSEGSEKFVKVVEEANKEEIKYLEKLKPEQAITLLSKESDLIFSSVLTLLPPATSAGVIKLLPPGRSVAVIKMLSNKTSVNSDILKTIVSKLNEKSKEILENEKYKVEGTKRLLDIIKNSDSDIAEQIILSLEKEEPELAQTLKDSIFTFNDIIRMPRKSLEFVLKNYSEKEIAFILKGTSDEIKNVYLTCVTKRKKELILDEINLLGQVKKSDVDDKRKEFVSYIRNLGDEGKIVIFEDKEIYVE